MAPRLTAHRARAARLVAGALSACALTAKALPVPTGGPPRTGELFLWQPGPPSAPASTPAGDTGPDHGEMPRARSLLPAPAPTEAGAAALRPAQSLPLRQPAPGRAAPPPGLRAGTAARPADPAPTELPIADPATADEPLPRAPFSLGELLLPLDDADEASFREAAMSFVASTKEAVPWLQPALDTLRANPLVGESQELFRALGLPQVGWFGRHEPLALGAGANATRCAS